MSATQHSLSFNFLLWISLYFLLFSCVFFFRSLHSGYSFLRSVSSSSSSLASSLCCSLPFFFFTPRTCEHFNFFCWQRNSDTDVRQQQWVAGGRCTVLSQVALIWCLKALVVYDWEIRRHQTENTLFTCHIILFILGVFQHKIPIRMLHEKKSKFVVEFFYVYIYISHKHSLTQTGLI